MYLDLIDSSMMDYECVSSVLRWVMDGWGWWLDAVDLVNFGVLGFGYTRWVGDRDGVRGF